MAKIDRGQTDTGNILVTSWGKVFMLRATGISREYRTFKTSIALKGEDPTDPFEVETLFKLKRGGTGIHLLKYRK